MTLESREPVILGHGQRNRRKTCTDWYCCLLFVVCLIGLLALACYGFHYGDTSKFELVVSGRDVNERRCGKDADVKEYPLTYFTLEAGQTAPSKWTDDWIRKLKPVCTNTCPQPQPSKITTTEASPREQGLCAADMYQNKLCTWYNATTNRFLNYCIDTGVFNLPGADWPVDLRASMYHLLAIFPVAIIIGFVYLATMERCGGFFVWSVILLVIVLPAGIGLWMYHDATTNSQLKDVVNINSNDEKIIAVGFWVLSGFFLLITCCSLKSINGVAKVVKVTSEFLKDVPSQFLQPLIFGSVHLVVMVAWLAILVLVLSVEIQDVQPGDMSKCLAEKNFMCVEWKQKYAALATIFLLLMIYWILNFLHACSHFGTAFAVHEWYFTSPDPATGNRKPSMGGHTLCDCRLSVKGVATGLRNHAGSFAFGSLCISICKVIKLLLCWAKKDTEAHSNNAVLRCCLKCANCIAECMERYIEFISEHAYVEIAIQGQGFCKSAQEAMVLTVRNPVLFAVVGRVACLVKILGVSVIAMVGALVVRLTLGWWPPVGLQSTMPPIVTAAVFSFFIGELMLHPFTVAARSCLHCFVLDKNTSYDGARTAQYCPKALNTFVEQHDEDREHSRGCCC